MKFGKLYEEVRESYEDSDRKRRGGKGGKDGRGKDRDDVVEAAIVSSLISIIVTSAVFMVIIYFCMRRNKKLLSATAELKNIRNTNDTPQRNSELSADFGEP